jgi:phosphoadenosine phosphosulfate reductase
MKYLVGYSGGADSQVALDLALAKYDDVEIIFIDTSIEFPETLDMMLETAKFYGLEIRFLRAAKTFEEYLDDFGGMYPSWRRRWCQDRLKERPLKKYINSLIRRGLRRDAQEQGATSSPQSGSSVAVTVIDGIRRDESNARKKRSPMEPHRSGKWDIEHIIFNWTKPEVFAYIRENRLPLNPLYGMGYSRTCTRNSTAKHKSGRPSTGGGSAIRLRIAKTILAKLPPDAKLSFTFTPLCERIVIVCAHTHTLYMHSIHRYY